MKKLTSICLSFVLIFSLFSVVPITASAATYSGNCGTNVSWNLDTSTGVLNITGNGAMTDYTATSDAPWYRYRSY